MASDLDADVASLINLGLSLHDIERLWSGVHGLSSDDVRAAGRRLLGESSALPIGRQVSVGLELLSCRNSNSSEVSRVAALIEEEEPPEKFRDPIMMTLIDEPMVLSSGFHFDRSTLYDKTGAFRFTCCPMTREAITQQAFPLHYLRREIIEYKLHRFDAILEAARQCEREPTQQLLIFAKRFLDSLTGECYQKRAADYWQVRGTRDSNE